MPKISLSGANALDKYMKDPDIENFINVLSKIQKDNAFVINRFDEIKQFLSNENIEKIKLAKLLYCLNFYPSCYLIIGIIIENILNEVIKYAQDNNLLPAHINDARIEQFINQDSIGQKGKQLKSLDLFNDSKASQYVAIKAEGLSVLRNYGGHSNFSSFLAAITADKQTNDKEILEALELIKYIYIAFDKIK